MAKIEGRQLICDRCGKSIFLNLLGSVTRDGGFSVDRNYEKAEGWEWISHFGDLCPDCVARWKFISDDFMRTGKVTKEK